LLFTNRYERPSAKRRWLNINNWQADFGTKGWEQMESCAQVSQELSIFLKPWGLFENNINTEIL